MHSVIRQVGFILSRLGSIAWQIFLTSRFCMNDGLEGPLAMLPGKRHCRWQVKSWAIEFGKTCLIGCRFRGLLGVSISLSFVSIECKRPIGRIGSPGKRPKTMLRRSIQEPIGLPGGGTERYQGELLIRRGLVWNLPRKPLLPIHRGWAAM